MMFFMVKLQTGNFNFTVKMEKLTTLAMWELNLTELPNITNLPNLKELDLSSNEIQHFDVKRDNLIPMKGVAEVNLSGNPLTEVNVEKISRVFPSLKKFYADVSEDIKWQFTLYYSRPLNFIRDTDDDF